MITVKAMIRLSLLKERIRKEEWIPVEPESRLNGRPLGLVEGDQGPRDMGIDSVCQSCSKKDPWIKRPGDPALFED